MCYPLLCFLLLMSRDTFSTCILIERLTKTLGPYFPFVYVFFFSSDKIYRLVVFYSRFMCMAPKIEGKNYFNELLFYPEIFFIDFFRFCGEPNGRR